MERSNQRQEMEMKPSEVYASAATAIIAGQPALLNEPDIEQCFCNDGADRSSTAHHPLMPLMFFSRYVLK